MDRMYIPIVNCDSNIKMSARLLQKYTSATLCVLCVLSKQYPNVNRCVKQNDSFGELSIYFPGTDFPSLQVVCHWHCMSTQSIGPSKVIGLWMYYLCPISSLINRQIALRPNLIYPKPIIYIFDNFFSVKKETFFDVRYLHFNALSVVSDNNHRQRSNRIKPHRSLREKLGVPHVSSCVVPIPCPHNSKGTEEGLVEAAASISHKTAVFFAPTDANSKVRQQLAI